MSKSLNSSGGSGWGSPRSPRALRAKAAGSPRAQSPRAQSPRAMSPRGASPSPRGGSPSPRGGSPSPRTFRHSHSPAPLSDTSAFSATGSAWGSVDPPSPRRPRSPTVMQRMMNKSSRVTEKDSNGLYQPWQEAEMYKYMQLQFPTAVSTDTGTLLLPTGSASPAPGARREWNGRSCVSVSKDNPRVHKGQMTFFDSPRELNVDGTNYSAGTRFMSKHVASGVQKHHSGLH